VRVRETAEGEIVNFHCRVNATLTVREVHEKVDDVERALRQKFRRSSVSSATPSRGRECRLPVRAH